MAIIPIADVITTERLPIDAQDIVTKVRLVIAGNRAGREPWTEYTATAPDEAPITNTYVTPFPAPVAFEYEAPEHATYRVERSFALPEGFDPFLPPTDTSIPEPGVTNFSNPGDPSAVRDGDPTTYAENTSSGTCLITYFGEDLEGLPAFGFRVRYALAPSTALRERWRVVRAFNTFLSASNLPVVISTRQYALAEGSGLESVSEEYAVTLYDARGLPINHEDPGLIQRFSTQLNVQFTDAGTARVFQFYPLVLDVDLLEDVAKANVRLPAQNPTRVTVAGVVPPDREHTITGWPGGDFTAPVAQQQYELGRTIIDFEQAGAPTGLPAEAVEAARERTTAVKAEVARAGYSVKMGERQ
jgi:hypothetical protein